MVKHSLLNNILRKKSQIEALTYGRKGALAPHTPYEGSRAQKQKEGLKELTPWISLILVKWMCYY
jgi:hypothetical protein